MPLIKRQQWMIDCLDDSWTFNYHSNPTTVLRQDSRALLHLTDTVIVYAQGYLVCDYHETLLDNDGRCRAAPINMRVFA